MITFIADYPNDINIRDGLMQRVASIDHLVKDKKRIYLSISLKRNFNKKIEYIDNCSIYHLNLFKDFLFIREIINKSDVIYSHSIMNLIRVNFIYDPKKTILDIHGVVPEEHQEVGKVFLSKIYNFVEKKAIIKCKNLIFVTNNMLNYYENKYNRCLKNKSIILPICDVFSNSDIVNVKDNLRPIVTYAGGIQKWQNIDLMFETIKEMNILSNGLYDFYLFFPQQSLEYIKNKYQMIISDAHVNISSLPKEEMINFLKKADYGFILRDDMVVNQVACPTKLIEYIENDIIPIVKSRNIGDFNNMGLQSIFYQDLLTSQDKLSVAEARKINKNILKKFKLNVIINRKKLKEYIGNGML